MIRNLWQTQAVKEFFLRPKVIAQRMNVHVAVVTLAAFIVMILAVVSIQLFKGEIVSSSATPGSKHYAKAVLHSSKSQWRCLNSLWEKESGWNHRADNPSSSAYGIPQALPGSKMGTGWRTNYRVQVRWGIRYIHARYHSACGAWAHSKSHGWY